MTIAKQRSPKQLLARNQQEVVIEIESVALTSWGYTARMRDALPKR